MNILVFGDSIAVGAFDTERNGWVSLMAMDQYEKSIASRGREYNDVINVSVSGNTSTDLLHRIESDMKGRKGQDGFGVSILAIGTNDAAKVNGVHQVSFDTFSKNIDALTGILQETSDKVVVLGLPPVFEKLTSPWCFDQTANWMNEELAKYDAEIQRITSENNLLFIPMQDVLDRNSDQHLPEGLHPNANGHRLIYERVKGEFKKTGIL